MIENAYVLRRPTVNNRFAKFVNINDSFNYTFGDLQTNSVGNWTVKKADYVTAENFTVSASGVNETNVGFEGFGINGVGPIDFTAPWSSSLQVNFPVSAANATYAELTWSGDSSIVAMQRGYTFQVSQSGGFFFFFIGWEGGVTILNSAGNAYASGVHTMSITYNGIGMNFLFDGVSIATAVALRQATGRHIGFGMQQLAGIVPFATNYQFKGQLK